MPLIDNLFRRRKLQSLSFAGSVRIFQVPADKSRFTASRGIIQYEMRAPVAVRYHFVYFIIYEDIR